MTRSINTKQRGESAETMIVAAFVHLGHAVLLPVGDNQRYDFVVDVRDGRFLRVQSKYGAYEKGVVVFRPCSNYYHRNGECKTRTYVGDVDVFAVFCAHLMQVFIVPVHSCGKRMVKLRVEPASRGQAKNIRHARDSLLFDFRGSEQTKALSEFVDLL